MIVHIFLLDAECDDGWKYSSISNTFYCYHEFAFGNHGDAEGVCDSLSTDIFPDAELVAIESAEEHQFLIDNVPASPGMIYLLGTNITSHINASDMLTYTCKL